MTDENHRAGKETGKKRTLPAAARPYMFRPGQSGNPGGRPSLKEFRAACRDVLNRGAVERMAELARLSNNDFGKDGILTPLDKKSNGSDIARAIHWLALFGYGPPQSFGPPEEPTRAWGEFRPELLSPAQRQFVQRALELIRQASVQPGTVVEEVRKP
jgi:hypothetical protein